MAIMHIIHPFDANRRSDRPDNRAKRTIALSGSTSLWARPGSFQPAQPAVLVASRYGGLS